MWLLWHTTERKETLLVFRAVYSSDKAGEQGLAKAEAAGVQRRRGM